jgi:hypothetical protein
MQDKVIHAHGMLRACGSCFFALSETFAWYSFNKGEKYEGIIKVHAVI